MLSLQEPEDASTEGLHVAVKQTITNAKLNSRQDRMVGVESDGTSANKTIYALEKSADENHLVFSWCLLHKLEFALHDSGYYLFKKATLKWCLFK